MGTINKIITGTPNISIINGSRAFAASKIAQERKSTFKKGQETLFRRLVDLALGKFGLDQAELEMINFNKEEIELPEKLTILATGKETKKMINGRETTVTSFVGFYGEYGFAQIGIGYTNHTSDEIRMIENLGATEGVVEYLRALEIFDLLPTVEEGTLYKSLCAASLKVRGLEVKYSREIENIIGKERRDQIAQSLPKDLFIALQKLWEFSLNFSSWDLVEILEKEIDLEMGKKILMMMIEECLFYEFREGQRMRNQTISVAGIIDPDVEARLIKNNQLSSKFNKEEFADSFKAFHKEIINALGKDYLLAMAEKAFAVIKRYSEILKVDPDFLSVFGPILAGINGKVKDELFSFFSAKIAAFLNKINRNLNEKELLFLNLMAQECTKAGYSRINNLIEAFQVNIYYPKSNDVVVGGEITAETKPLALQTKSTDLVAADDPISMITLLIRSDLPKKYAKELIEDGLLAIRVQKRRGLRLKKLLRLIELDRDHNLSREGKTQFSMGLDDEIREFNKLKRTDFAGIEITATEAFLNQRRLLLELKNITLVPIPNKAPRTFSIPSALNNEERYYSSYDEYTSVKEKITGVIRKVFKKGSFLSELNFKEEISFFGSWIYVASADGWIINPDAFLFRVQWISVDDNLLDHDNRYKGYYFFDVKNNRFRKIVDPEDLELIKDWRQFASADMTMSPTKTKDGKVTISYGN